MANPLLGPLLGFMSKLSHPKLFVVMGIFFLIDLCIPNMIPFDDIALGLATLLLANWRKKPAAQNSDQVQTRAPIEGEKSKP